MNSGDIDEQVRRMYDVEIERSQARHEELERRYCPTQEPKRISKATLQECITRLHHVDYQKRDEELFKKYVYPHDPKMSKIRRSEEAAMANRLSTKGS